MAGPLHILGAVIAGIHYHRYSRSAGSVAPPFRVVFNEIPAGWIHTPCWGDLTWVWRKNGIPATGIAGFLCGDKDSSGHSTLWDPNSPNYLAWCGAYIFKPDDFSEFYRQGVGATETARNLGYQDDMSWSTIYGNKNPFYEEIHIERLEQPLVSTSFQSESYFSTVRCQTYLGPRSRNLTARVASITMARLYKRTSGILLDPHFFLPRRDHCRGHSYESVLRDVWVTRILFPDKGIIYVIYASSTRAENDRWNHTDVLKADFSRLFGGVTLLP